MASALSTDLLPVCILESASYCIGSAVLRKGTMLYSGSPIRIVNWMLVAEYLPIELSDSQRSLQGCYLEKHALLLNTAHNHKPPTRSFQLLFREELYLSLSLKKTLCASVQWIITETNTHRIQGNCWVSQKLLGGELLKLQSRECRRIIIIWTCLVLESSYALPLLYTLRLGFTPTS